MNPAHRPITIATRGSALALAQANAVLAQCRAAFPKLTFDLKIIKTTGDKLQRASIANPDQSLPKGLFTKELEVALVKHQADLAVHSLKDLPTDLPAGLVLGAVSERADVRDIFIYRDAEYLWNLENPGTVTEEAAKRAEKRGSKRINFVKDFFASAIVATSSNRRKAQLLALRPDFKVVEIRGNVVTRLQKLAEKPDIDALVLAAAGLERLNFHLELDGHLEGDAVPDGLLAFRLEVEEMLPCIGQAALGIEIRADDECMASICERLNHFNTYQCVSAERAFLRGIGGGCHTPVAAYAEVMGDLIRMRAVSFIGDNVRRAESKRSIREAIALGEQLAAELRA